jgi:SpoVK/Ycf46/Vps4 family AAA+-type ATPase
MSHEFPKNINLGINSSGPSPMATAEQLKALLRSHIKGDESHFYAVAMQMAAEEARQGHSKIAHELRALIDEAKKHSRSIEPQRSPILITQPRGELSGLLSVSYPKLRLVDMILDKGVYDRIHRLIKEQRTVERIRSFGLRPRRKLLLTGPPGTGKTMSAGVIAGELSLPLFVVRLDNLITKYMGETSAKLRLIFDSIAQVRGVYLFDEFDSIGSKRTASNDVGEIRRVLSSFLQFIEQDTSDSLILAATNHPDLLDHALFRRFDDVITYGMPSRTYLIRLLQARLATIRKASVNWKELARIAEGLSHADITRACDEAIKDVIIHGRTALKTKDVFRPLAERKAIHVR